MDARRRMKFNATRERGGFLYSRFQSRLGFRLVETTTGQAAATGKKRRKKHEGGRKKLRNADFGETVATTL